MEYPKEFSRAAKARLIAAVIRADSDYANARRASPPLTEPIGVNVFVHTQMQWVAMILGAYAHEACELGARDEWDVDRVVDVVNRFRADLLTTVRNRCNEVVRRSAGQLDEAWLENTFAEIAGWIEGTQKWRDYQRELLEVANRQSNPLLNPPSRRNQWKSPSAALESLRSNFLIAKNP